MLRRLLPLAVIVPIAGGATEAWLVDARRLEPEAAIWIVAFVALAIAVTTVWSASRRTDRHRQELAVEHALHADLLGSIPDGVYETRLDGDVVMANAPLATLLGFADVAALVGSVRSVRDLWDVPKDRDRLVARIAAGEEAGMFETRLRRRHGAPVDVAVSWRAVVGPDGGPIGLRGTVRDITADVAMRSRLADAQEQFRLAFVVGPHGRLVLDTTGDEIRVALVNPAALKMLGYSEAEFIATDPWSFTHPDDLDMEAAAFAGWQRGDSTDLSFATRRRHRDGSWVPVWLSASTHFADDGRIRYAICTIEDLRPRLAAEAEAVRAWDEAMQRIALAVEYRDEETGAHVERMSALCERIALDLGFDPERAALLRRASQMHDAGKVAIPDAVLLKPGRLTAEERSIMETHTTIGHELLGGTGSPVLELAAVIAWTHHERVDGTGYPRRLRGDAIPIEGRIAAVADVFDALTSDRVYRPGHALPDALAIMRDGRGTQFEPEVLDALLRRVADGPTNVLADSGHPTLLGRPRSDELGCETDLTEDRS